MNKRTLLFLPFILFAGFAFMLWYGLGKSDKQLPTALAGKPIPAFELPELYNGSLVTDEILAMNESKVLLVNFFASWCVPCRAEHPLLIELAKNPDISVVGIAYKNEITDAKRFLTQLGNPYSTTAYDLNGRTSIDWGVSGVPETFIISNGQIRDRIGQPLVNPTGLEKLKSILLSLGVEVKI